jgi:hypothetical protein
MEKFISTNLRTAWDGTRNRAQPTCPNQPITCPPRLPPRFTNVPRCAQCSGVSRNPVTDRSRPSPARVPKSYPVATGSPPPLAWRRSGRQRRA